MRFINELLRQVRLSRKIHQKIVALAVLMLFVTTISAQNHPISGTITDENGVTMIGVNIVIKGTTTGTVTNFEGKYNLEASSSDTLMFSYIGYLPQEMLVGNSSTLDVTLLPDLKNIDEVVVVGYGVQKKSDVTGAIASIKAEEISKMKVNSVSETIQGRAAGVSVTNNSGAPGSDNVITVRGIGTINGSDPLWVVDGVIGGGGYVNPADIESMEILKDASACAIYGSRGANGVILITTKKGKDGKGQVTYDGSFRLSSLPKSLSLLQSKDWAMLRNEAHTNAGQNAPDEIVNWPTLTGGTDWQDEVTRQAFTQEHNISFAGGTEKLNYFLSFNHMNQEGIVHKSNYKRTTMRLNTSYKIKDWLTIGENIAIAKEITNEINQEDEWNSVLIQSIAIDPITPVRQEDGSWGGSNYNTMNNPVAHLDRTHNEEDDFSVGGNAYLDFKILDGLTFRSSFGVETGKVTSWDYEPTFFVKTGEENAQSALEQGFFEEESMTVTNYATYAKDINLHSFTLMAGTEYTNGEQAWFGTRATDLISEDDMRLITIDNASGNAAASSYGNYDKYRIFSLYGRLSYSYNGKYMFTYNGRIDESSKFGPDKRKSDFHAFSLGWNISEEAFMQNLASVNKLKLRIGYGQIGNDKVRSSEWLSSATSGRRYVFGNTIVDGTSFPQIANPELGWETTETLNFGIDGAFYNNMLTAGIDIYSKNTKEMLVPTPLQAHVGAEIDTYQNIGEMSNNGIEFELGFKKVFSDFKLDLSGTFAYNKNEVVYLGNADYILDAEFMGLQYISRTEVGQPVASFYGYKCDGLFQNQAEIDAYVKPDGTPIQNNVAPGDIKYKADENGELVMDWLGSPIPVIAYGLNINMEYEGFDFTVFCQGVSGNEVFNATKFYTQNPSMRYNVDESMLDRWMFEGSTNDPNTPRLNLSDVNNSKRSDRFVEDGAYFRIKSVQLGYNMNTKLLNGHVDRIRIYVGATNLYTFTKYSGYDPEVGRGYDGDLDFGVDRAKYPVPRTYLAGISVSF